MGDNRYYEFFSRRAFSQEEIKKYLSSLVKRYHIRTFIIEEFVSGPARDNDQPLDYKFHVFNGKTLFVAREDRAPDPFSVAFVDANFMDITGDLMHVGSKWKRGQLIKSENSEEMLEAANKIGDNLNIPYVRVDMYSDNKKLYLG
ncbi:MAG: hypothetical protein K2H64_03060 [Desulfovibrio sp.]|nr:hypothetical protein [Desulfovibrio sp.]